MRTQEELVLMLHDMFQDLLDTLASRSGEVLVPLAVPEVSYVGGCAPSRYPM
jgi:hypothetical protein